MKTQPVSSELLRNATLLTARPVADLLGVHVRTFWRYSQPGIIPQPIRLGQRTVRWRLSDLRDHLDQLSHPEKGGRL